MYALPHTYRHVQATEDTLIEITIQSEAGGKWYLQKGTDGWGFMSESDRVADSKVSINPDIAWKLFTKAIAPEIGMQNSTLEGNIKLGEKIFNTIAVMA
jgi:hypothetical protein